MRSPAKPLGIAGGQSIVGRTTGAIVGGVAVDEDDGLDEDHRLLLRSSLPLLKSRNAGVVLGVCSLHYYCGVADIKSRSSIGKAMVRIYHDRREIQFVVLNSIRMLVWECPSAFTPFLNDFFVKVRHVLGKLFFFFFNSFDFDVYVYTTDFNFTNEIKHSIFQI